MTYHELSIEERVTIQTGRLNGLSLRSIARLLEGVVSENGKNRTLSRL